jgi:hypothetical protein
VVAEAERIAELVVRMRAGRELAGSDRRMRDGL